MFPSRIFFFCIILILDYLTLQSKVEGQEITKVGELADRFFKWRLKTSPAYGTKYGFHDRDGEVEQFTPEAFKKTVDEAQEFLDEAKTIVDTHISPRDKATLAVLKDQLSSYISGYKFRYHGLYLGVALYEHPIRNWQKISGWMKFKTEIDFRRAIQRYKNFAKQIDQQIALMKLANEKNITGPDVEKLKSVIIKQYTSWPEVATQTFLFKPFKDISSLITDQAIAQNITDEVLHVLSNDVKSSIKRYAEYIQNEYSSHLRSTPGVLALPQGKEYYAACLKWHLSLNITAEEVHNIGLKEVARIKKLMEKIQEKDGFNGDMRSYILHLKEEPQNRFETQDEMISTFKAYMKEVHGHLHKVLAKVPKEPISFVANDSPNGGNVYIEGSLDGSRPGEFTANVWSPRNQTKFSKLALTLHEAEPGHHTQSTAAVDSGIPNFRRAVEFRKYVGIPFNWPFYSAYVEGWGLYAESLGEEMGVYRGKYDLLGRYDSEIFRACRLVIDTGIHHMGWTFEKAVAYLEAHTALTKSFMENEITRYIYYPGQATSYKIGELLIKDLRTMSQKELGSSFDVREFNTAVLDLGPAPLSILEDHINQWLQEKKLGGRFGASLSGADTLCGTFVLMSLTVAIVLSLQVND